MADLDMVEINEAFASVGIASMRDLGLDPSIVNVHGGAIALGHPVGMSGARILLSAAYELQAPRRRPRRRRPLRRWRPGRGDPVQHPRVIRRS